MIQLSRNERIALGLTPPEPGGLDLMPPPDPAIDPFGDERYLTQQVEMDELAREMRLPNSERVAIGLPPLPPAHAALEALKGIPRGLLVGIEGMEQTFAGIMTAAIDAAGLPRPGTEGAGRRIEFGRQDGLTRGLASQASREWGGAAERALRGERGSVKAGQRAIREETFLAPSDTIRGHGALDSVAGLSSAVGEGVGQLPGFWGAGAVGGPAGVYAMGGAMGFQEQYERSREDLKKQGMDEVEANQLAARLGVYHAVGSAYWERLGLDKVLPGSTKGKFLETLKSQAGRSWAKRGASVGEAALTEALTEATQQAQHNIISLLSGSEEDLFEGIAEGAVVGGFVGGIGRGAGVAGEVALGRTDQRDKKPGPTAEQAKGWKAEARRGLEADFGPDGARREADRLFEWGRQAVAEGVDPGAWIRANKMTEWATKTGKEEGTLRKVLDRVFPEIMPIEIVSGSTGQGEGQGTATGTTQRKGAGAQGMGAEGQTGVKPTDEAGAGEIVKPEPKMAGGEDFARRQKMLQQKAEQERREKEAKIPKRAEAAYFKPVRESNDAGASLAEIEVEGLEFGEQLDDGDIIESGEWRLWRVNKKGHPGDWTLEAAGVNPDRPGGPPKKASTMSYKFDSKQARLEMGAARRYAGKVTPESQKPASAEATPGKPEIVQPGATATGTATATTQRRGAGARGTEGKMPVQPGAVGPRVIETPGDVADRLWSEAGGDAEAALAAWDGLAKEARDYLKRTDLKPSQRSRVVERMKALDAAKRQLLEQQTAARREKLAQELTAGMTDDADALKDIFTEKRYGELKDVGLVMEQVEKRLTEGGAKPEKWLRTMRAELEQERSRRAKKTGDVEEFAKRAAAPLTDEQREDRMGQAAAARAASGGMFGVSGQARPAAVEPATAGEVPEMGTMTRERWERELRDVWGHDEADVQAIMAIMDGLAGWWARMNPEASGGRSEAFYERWLAGTLGEAELAEFQRLNPELDEGTLRQIVGRLARTVGDPGRAEELERAGRTRRQIWNETGWWRGPDGKWRFEIDSSKMKMVGIHDGQQKIETSLSDVVDYPELFESYPQLGEIHVAIKIVPGRKDSHGSFVRDRNHIGVIANSAADARQILIHEIQHAVQQIEDFESGGNLNTEQTEQGRDIDRLYELKREMDALAPGDEKRRVELAKEIGALSGRVEWTPYERYLLLAGEVEARVVQRRLDMTPAERRETPPWLTMEDMLRDEGLLSLSTTPEDVMIVRARGNDEKVVKMLYQIAAYHGTAADFEQFSTEFMGSGEGVQMFGWGLYFSDLEAIARHYAEQNAREKIKIEFKKPISDGLRDFFVKTYQEARLSTTSPYNTESGLLRQVIEDLNLYVQNAAGLAAAGDGKTFYEMWMDELRGITHRDFKILESKRALYTTTLHKGKGPEAYDYLQWRQAPTAAQIEKINAQFRKEYGTVEDVRVRIEEATRRESVEYEKKPEPRPDDDPNELLPWQEAVSERDWLSKVLQGMETLKEFEELNREVDGAMVYDALEDALGSPREASLFLLRAGIDGVRYEADQGRGAGWNYVVFDPAAITIENKTLYQRQGGARGAMRWLEDGRAILYALKNKDRTTAIHEVGHVLRRVISETDPDMGQIIEEWASQEALKSAKSKVQSENLKDRRPGEWTRGMEEVFAEGWERYLADGKAPTKALRAAFARLKELFRAVYARIKGTPLEKDVPAAVRAIFDQVLTPVPGAEVARSMTEGKKFSFAGEEWRVVRFIGKGGERTDRAWAVAAEIERVGAGTATTTAARAETQGPQRETIPLPDLRLAWVARQWRKDGQIMLADEATVRGMHEATATGGKRPARKGLGTVKDWAGVRVGVTTQAEARAVAAASGGKATIIEIHTGAEGKIQTNNEYRTSSNEQTKVRVQDVDTPAQGQLSQARKSKERTWKRVKELRERLKNEKIGGNRHGLRLELMTAEEDHKDALRMEQDALDAIESRANELGQTTKDRPSAQAGEGPVVLFQGGDPGAVERAGRAAALGPKARGTALDTPPVREQLAALGRGGQDWIKRWGGTLLERLQTAFPGEPEKAQEIYEALTRLRSFDSTLKTAIVDDLTRIYGALEKEGPIGRRKKHAAVQKERLFRALDVVRVEDVDFERKELRPVGAGLRRAGFLFDNEAAPNLKEGDVVWYFPDGGGVRVLREGVDLTASREFDAAQIEEWTAEAEEAAAFAGLPDAGGFVGLIVGRAPEDLIQNYTAGKRRLAWQMMEVVPKEEVEAAFEALSPAAREIFFRYYDPAEPTQRLIFDQVMPALSQITQREQFGIVPAESLVGGAVPYIRAEGSPVGAQRLIRTVYNFTPFPYKYKGGLLAPEELMKDVKKLSKAQRWALGVDAMMNEAATTVLSMSLQPWKQGDELGSGYAEFSRGAIKEPSQLVKAIKRDWKKFKDMGIDPDEVIAALVALPDKKTGAPSKVRVFWKIPKVVLDEITRLRDDQGDLVSPEAAAVQRAVTRVFDRWLYYVNTGLLARPSTSVRNATSGALQYAGKVWEDWWRLMGRAVIAVMATQETKELAREEAQQAMDELLGDVWALFGGGFVSMKDIPGAMFEKQLTKSALWMVEDESVLRRAVDAALIPFNAVERHFKKAAFASVMGAHARAAFRMALKEGKVTKADRAAFMREFMIQMPRQEMKWRGEVLKLASGRGDSVWMDAWKKTGAYTFHYAERPAVTRAIKEHRLGRMVIPFPDYQYFKWRLYGRYLNPMNVRCMLPNNVIKALGGRPLTEQERVDMFAKFMTGVTLFGMAQLFLALLGDDDREGKALESDKFSYEYDTTGRVRVWRNAEGQDYWLRMMDQPFLGDVLAMRAIARGDIGLSDFILETQSVGPAITTGLSAMGYKTKYDLHRDSASTAGRSAQPLVLPLQPYLYYLATSGVAGLGGDPFVRKYWDSTGHPIYDFLWGFAEGLPGLRQKLPAREDPATGELMERDPLLGHLSFWVLNFKKTPMDREFVLEMDKIEAEIQREEEKIKREIEREIRADQERATRAKKRAKRDQ